jgi:hypothetical protein
MGLRSWVEQGRLLGAAQLEAREGHPRFAEARDGRVFEVDRDGYVEGLPLPGLSRRAEPELEAGQ